MSTSNIFIKLKRIFVDDSGKIIDESDDLYKILENVNIPGHLKNVKFKLQSFSDHESGLIFTGEDSKGRVQYYYGKDHVAARNESRLDLVINVHKNIHKIENFIKEHNKITNPVTKEYLFSVMLQLETSLFIRLGKEKYLKANGTIGLNTLKPEHVMSDQDNVILKFQGKTGVIQEFNLSKKSLLGKHVQRLANLKNEFLFSDTNNNKLSESYIYTQMNMFDVKIKDLRTYGVNKIFLREWDKLLSETDEIKKPKKMLKHCIEITAKIIGHEANTCKSNYLIKEILELVDDKWFYDSTKTHDVTGVIKRLIVK
ncbi:DNA topoisomerase I [Salmon gill poxvirus]